MAFLVAGIDVGTTYSGWAYSLKHDFDQDPTKITTKPWNSGSFVSPKAPTAVLIKPDGITLAEFGYDAETRYAELASGEEHGAWYYFRRFKMKLFKSKSFGMNLKIKDETGKRLSAMTVFSLTIKFLKNDMIQCSQNKLTGTLEEQDIKWVITVPAIWNETAKQFMIEAARQAGIPVERLSLALEPEAVSIYSRYCSIQNPTPTFNVGTMYLICDAGGGTIDITVHEVLNDFKLREVTKASGGYWGGTKVDNAFEQMIAEITGSPVFTAWKSQCTDDYLELMRRFEIKKRNVSTKTSTKIVVCIPMSLNELLKSQRKIDFKMAIEQSQYKGCILQNMDKLQFDPKIIRSLFKVPINNVVAHIEALVKSHGRVSHIVMAGGFSESPLLQEAIRSSFPDKTVISPPNASLAVLNGAVIHGHNKRVIQSRIAKYTYGVRCFQPFDPRIHSPDRIIKQGPKAGLVQGAFQKWIEIGQELTEDSASVKTTFKPVQGNSGFTLELFCSSQSNPKYVDEPGCFKIGILDVDCTDQNGFVGPSEVSIFLGGTEFRVTAVNSNGRMMCATFKLSE